VIDLSRDRRETSRKPKRHAFQWKAAQCSRPIRLIARSVCVDQVQYDANAYVMWFIAIHVNYMLMIHIYPRFDRYESFSLEPALGSNPDAAPFNIGDTIVQWLTFQFVDVMKRGQS
jgi:hypothetical protein